MFSNAQGALTNGERDSKSLKTFAHVLTICMENELVVAEYKIHCYQVIKMIYTLTDRFYELGCFITSLNIPGISNNHMLAIECTGD